MHPSPSAKGLLRLYDERHGEVTAVARRRRLRGSLHGQIIALGAEGALCAEFASGNSENHFTFRDGAADAARNRGGRGRGGSGSLHRTGPIIASQFDFGTTDKEHTSRLSRHGDMVHHPHTESLEGKGAAIREAANEIMTNTGRATSPKWPIRSRVN